MGGGFSFGSGMTYMMGVSYPYLFAAVSPNNGIGPMSKAVEDRIREIKAKGDVRIPMMIVYGDVDAGGSHRRAGSARRVRLGLP